MKNKIIYVIIAIILLAVVISLIVVLSSGNGKVEDEVENIKNESNVENINNTKAPSKLSEDEKDVSESKEQELFNFIPKIYSEAIAPFDSSFMLDAVMSKISNSYDEPDFSVSDVDNYVKKIFGKDAKINKAEVSKPDVERSLYYYSEEAGSYAVIPVGYEGILKYQILKNVTETDDAYYVYTYVLIGGYSYDETSIVQDEFGDVDYSNAKVQVIIGDKDGNDLIHIFDNYTLLYNEDIWIEKYSNLMPVFRYKLKKDNNNYYLVEVEQINY